MDFEKPYASTESQNTSSTPTYAAPVAPTSSGGMQRSARKSMVARNDSNKLGAVVMDCNAMEYHAYKIEDDNSAPTMTGRRLW